jgi:uncharacterized membrane protein
MAFENFISSHKQETILFFFIIIYVVYFITASFLRYDNFYTGRFDLGNMDQTVWNTINGRIFQLTDPNGTEIVSRLAFHADFILILLAPFYAIWDHPKILLLIQTVILVLGSVFVYTITREIINDKNLSLTLGVLFLLNPAMQFTNLYDFHAVSLATTFLLAAFYFAIKNKHIFVLIFLILAGITKEQVWITTALFGIYIFFSAKETPFTRSLLVKRFYAIMLFIVSISIFYYLIWHAIPNVRGDHHFALSFYSDFGDSPTSVIKNVISSPQKTLSTVLQEKQLDYLKSLFQPVGFMPIFALPFIIFAAPDLFINLLSNNPNLYQIYYQYTSTITPFIFISMIFAIKNIKKWFPKIPNIFYIYFLLFFTLKSAYDFGPLPGAKNANIAMFTKQLPQAKTIDNFLSTIPHEYSVAATNNVGSHLSHRRKIYTIPVGVDRADYIIFLLSDSSQRKMVEELRIDKNYIVVFSLKDFIAFKRKT